MKLENDESEKPTVLELGDLRMHVIKRNKRVGDSRERHEQRSRRENSRDCNIFRSRIPIAFLAPSFRSTIPKNSPFPPFSVRASR